MNIGDVIVYLKCLVLIVNLMTFKSSGRHTSEQDCWDHKTLPKHIKKVRYCNDFFIQNLS